MEPSGELAERFLDLLRDAGLPLAVVAVFGTCIALYQFSRGLSEGAYASERRVFQGFARSPRRVRAYASFVISHGIATTATIGLVTQVLANPTVAASVGTESSRVLWQVQAGVAAYFLAIDWWAFNYGDMLPSVAAVAVGAGGALLFLGVGAYEASNQGSWGVFLAWAAAIFVWFSALGWASSSGSDLARTVQN